MERGEELRRRATTKTKIPLRRAGFRGTATGFGVPDPPRIVRRQSRLRRPESRGRFGSPRVVDSGGSLSRRCPAVFPAVARLGDRATY